MYTRFSCLELLIRSRETTTILGFMISGFMAYELMTVMTVDMRMIINIEL